MPNNDSHQHVVKTTSQWEERAVEYWVVPRGCLCVELTPEGKTKLKVGEGNKYFSQLPYICDHGDLSNYYTKEETDTLLENLNRMAIVSTDVYDSKDDLPLVDNKLGDVRFVKSDNEDPDIYIWNGAKWISTKSDTDLSDYITKSEFEPVKNKVDEIYPKAHTHANKDTLDNITQEKLDEIDELAEMYVEVKGDISDLKSKSHTHSNKSLLDSITQSSLWTQPDRDKFNSLHNYDDTQVKFRLVTLEEKAHTHSNKTVLDGITQEKLDEIDELAATYVIIKSDLVDLKEKSHTHINKDILDGTTASYTIGQQNELYRLSQISTFLGAGPTWDGIFGYVPAPKMGQQTYFLRGDGTWAKGGDKYEAGEGIYIEEVSPSEYTSIIYNDGVIDVTQDDPDNLNILTFHYRDNVTKDITVNTGINEGVVDITQDDPDNLNELTITYADGTTHVIIIPGGESSPYVRVSTDDSYVLLHTKPSDWDDTWYKYYRLSYDEITTSPAYWNPTRHYKYENDNYVLGSPGDTFVSTTWYDKHYTALDPSTPVVFDTDVYYTGELNLIEDGELFDTAFEKVNEAIEHIERLEQNVQFLHDNKVDVRETIDPERIEFYYS